MVWESNRAEQWTIWTKRLDGSGLARLSPDEPGRQHCCAQISPDGRRVAYLSLPVSSEVYPGPEVFGELRLVAPDGSNERVVAGDAHTYFENRAMVWRSDRELIYLGAGQSTVLLDVETGEREVLLAGTDGEYGRLIDPTLAHATSGKATFDSYDRRQKAVSTRAPLAGCQPFFSQDGRWGYWIASPGGPIKRLDLVTRAASVVLKKSDPRLPATHGYLYFPKTSADGLLLTFAASPDQHDHVKGDYEVFAVETDPETLEVLDRPVRLTFDPAVDRFPDVFLESVALGRHVGEAPLTVSLLAGPGAESAQWRWSFGEGSTATGSAVRHTFARAGSYRVEAVGGPGDADPQRLTGRVVVRPPRPPEVVRVVTAERGRRLSVSFDEPVYLEDLAAELGSLRKVVEHSLSDDGRVLELAVSGEHLGPDTLQLTGITDRAERPNRMPPASIEIEPATWPSRREGLAFLWQNARGPNLMVDPESGQGRAGTVEPRGLARFDRNFAMRPSGGWFLAPADAARFAFDGLRKTYEMTLEIAVRPADGDPPPDDRAILVSGNRRGWDFALTQEGERLIWNQRVGSHGPGATARVELATVAPGRSTHVVVSSVPGRLTAFVDGEPAVDTAGVEGGFFHWGRPGLSFGAAWDGGAGWHGTIEHVALYDRALEPAEVRENLARYRFAVSRRPQVERLVVEARRSARSDAPDLREIAPYREALAFHLYEVERVVDGDGAVPGAVRVAHWVLLDGTPLEVGGGGIGERVRLTLEPFADQPQLEGAFVADTLGPGTEPLYFAVESTAPR